MPRLPAQPEPAVVAPTWQHLDAVVEVAQDRVQWVGRLALLERGLGWRVSQCLGLRGADVDQRAGTIRLRPELGKSAAERAGRTVRPPRWLLDVIATWGVTADGLLVGQPVQRSSAAEALTRCWRATGAPPELYRRRPDHAFRRCLITELTRARVDPEAADYYVGHRLRGVRGRYVDPLSLPLDEVAAAIPAPPCVRTVSGAEVVDLSQARQRRAR